MQGKKYNFVLGLAVGIAAIALIGFIAMSVAYFKASSESKDVVQKEDKDKIVDENKPEKKEVEVNSTDHIRGNPDAPITIVEFSDFQCSFCSRFHKSLEQLLVEYPNDVRWVYKHFPLDSIHPYARKAAEASECAADQDKFWEYNDGLFLNQRSISSNYLNELAKSLNLDMSEFEKCLSDGKYVKKVNSDFFEGQQLGVRGTPGGFMNGRELGGAVPLEQLEAMVESLK